MTTVTLLTGTRWFPPGDCPLGSTIAITVWGGGGGGFDGGTGGGGACAASNYVITLADITSGIPYAIGGLGSGSFNLHGNIGGTSTFGNAGATQIVAVGGTGAATGGAAASCKGQFTFAGGNGNSMNGGAGGNGGGAGGLGGTGSFTTRSGKVPGGGGGNWTGTWQAATGGNGAGGQVSLSYTPLVIPAQTVAIHSATRKPDSVIQGRVQANQTNLLVLVT